MDTYTSTTGEESCRLQLSDVYEIATSVGQEFQRLIGEFGSTTMSVLVSTVVGALEHLEVYVEEYQKLRTQNCKLRLENDHLATEKDDGKKLAAKNEKMLQKRDREISCLIKRNEQLLQFLHSQKTDSTTQSGMSLESAAEPTRFPLDLLEMHKCRRELEEPAAEFKSLQTPHHYEGHISAVPDVIASRRIHKRLSLVELERDKSARQLLLAQQSLHQLQEENQALREQLERVRAEAALQGLQESTGEMDLQDHETPRFYKKDLLAVLREKNELKEEYDALWDELAAAKGNLRKLEAQKYNRRPKAETRVKEILDSLTESIRTESARASSFSPNS